MAITWKGANIEVIDLGLNVCPAAFAQAVRDHHHDRVGMSALLTTTMPRMTNAIAAVNATGAPTRFVVGGAPDTPGFAEQTGADGFFADAALAVHVALGRQRERAGRWS